MKNNVREIIEWLKPIAIGVIVFFIIIYSIKPVVVQGDSMSPTLKNNEYLIVNKITYKIDNPKNNDIIVFNSHLKDIYGDNKNLIKRIIGIPGDQIKITGGKVYINDKCIYENYLSKEYTDGEIETLVPEGNFFVMGDNREVSLDSRDSKIGFVEDDQVLGKIFVRIFPFRRY